MRPTYIAAALTVILFLLALVCGCGSAKEAAAPPPPEATDAASDKAPDSGSEPAASDSPSMPKIDFAPAAREPLPAALDEVPVAPKEKAGYKVVRVFYGTDRARAGVDALGLFGPAGWHWIAGVLAVLTLGGMLLAFRSARRAEGGGPGKPSRGRVKAFVLVGLGLLLTLFALVQALSLQSQIAAIQFKKLETLYGGSRGQLEYGTCDVSIPECHRRGEVERPSLLRLEFRENPLKHLVLQATTPKAEEVFFDELRREIARSGNEDAFVFVHGYNVTFEAAAMRTAQLSYDLDFQGTPIFFSWPSAGYTHLYPTDENNVEWSIPHLKQFLTEIKRRSGAERIHLIAHSMGNRTLTRALEKLAAEMRGDDPDSERMFHQIILAAPDIDAEVFRRDLAPEIVKTASRVTLYASSSDQALIASKTFHGGYVRAGDSGENLMVVPGIDTIDVSDVEKTMLGHSYVGDNLFVIADLVQLIRTASPPSQRPGLSLRRLGNLVYWGFLVEESPVTVSP